MTHAPAPLALARPAPSLLATSSPAPRSAAARALAAIRVATPGARALTAALLAGAMVMGCQAEAAPDPSQAAGKDPKLAPQVMATRVEVATITPSRVTVRIVRPGEVEAAKEARVAAAMGGLIEQLSVDVGDVVREGQVLAKVDASLQAANRALAQVEVDDAKRELERLKQLGESVASARTDAAQARLDRAEAQLKIAAIQAGRALIKAPFAGVVSAVPVERGEVAPPGAPIATIARVDPAVVSVSVTDRDVGSLRIGGTASVITGGNRTPIEAVIRRIDPIADPKTRSFNVEVEAPNPDQRLRPGMIATVDFRETVADEAIMIPQDFLVTRLRDNGVFVLDDAGKAAWRPLTLGAVVRDQVVVDDGLRAGEKVVVLGQRGLSEGDPLIVSREGRCCVDGRIAYTTDAAPAADASPESGPAAAPAPSPATPEVPPEVAPGVAPEVPPEVRP